MTSVPGPELSSVELQLPTPSEVVLTPTRTPNLSGTSETVFPKTSVWTKRTGSEGEERGRHWNTLGVEEVLHSQVGNRHPGILQTSVNPTWVPRNPDTVDLLRGP